MQTDRMAKHVRRADKPKRAAAEMDCATAFQAMARDCLTRMQAQHPETIAGDAEALHQMRVAISRLRAVVAFFAPMSSDAAWPRLNTELAWLYALLGDARDADVMEALAHHKRYRKWAAGIVAHDDKEHDRLYRRVVAGLRSKRFQRLMDALFRWVEHGPWLTRRDDAQRRRTESLGQYRQCKLEHWRIRLIRKGRDLATMGGKRRHRLRIKVKRYRYALEALGDICPPAARTELRHRRKPAKGLQRALGDLRDLQHLRRIGASSRKPPGYAKLKKQLLATAHAAWRDLLLPRL
ncbi:MAG: CHAD domain-containing protein [Xanthobacteraceae bacterium]